MKIKLSEQLGKLLAKAVSEDVGRALAEDLGTFDPEADLTAHLVARKQKAQAVIITREDAVLCGTLWANEACRLIDKTLEIHWSGEDGKPIFKNQPFCLIKGNARSIHIVERTMLNFLQILSATTTLTRCYVDRIRHLPVKIFDTRKTIPGLRIAQKYAVACGGGSNHRLGLYDAMLIKENHMRGYDLQTMIRRADMIKNHRPEIPLIIEVENLQQLSLALGSQADRVLLDNFSLVDMALAVTMNQRKKQQEPDAKVKLLEVSGNITLDNILLVATTGIDCISVGALTKHVQAVDMSCLFVEE